MNKIEIIRALVCSGRARDVLDFVEGDSIYISDASLGAPQDPELRRIWVMVVHHLRFVSEFGDTPTTQCKDGKYFSPHPDDFNAWLDAGAPGVADEDVMAYINENPL